MIFFSSIKERMKIIHQNHSSRMSYDYSIYMNEPNHNFYIKKYF